MAARLSLPVLCCSLRKSTRRRAMRGMGKSAWPAVMTVALHALVLGLGVAGCGRSSPEGAGTAGRKGEERAPSKIEDPRSSTERVPDDGIPPEQREAVIEAFYRGLGHLERYEPGAI